MSGEGRAHVEIATRSLDEGRDVLQVGATLRDDGVAGALAAAVTEAAVARIRARERWPDADRLLFSRRALEQASDPAVSAWRARRFSGTAEVVDLAAGAGGDTIALARAADRVVALDRDESRLVLLGHNVWACGLEVDVVAGDGLALPVRMRGSLHVDPSRRRDGRRARRLADYEPPVGALRELLGRADGGALVVSPAVSLDDPDLPEGEVEFVQLGRDLVEAAVWTGELAAGSPRSATIIIEDGAVHRAAEQERQRLAVGGIGEWLVEVAPAAVRARIHDEIGAELGARRVSEARALLTVDEAPPTSPWYRAFPVEGEVPARPRQVREFLRRRDDAPVELVLHGMDVNVERWWRELGRPARAWGGRVIHLIRTADGATCVVTGPEAGTTGSVEVVPSSDGPR